MARLVVTCAVLGGCATTGAARGELAGEDDPRSRPGDEPTAIDPSDEGAAQGGTANASARAEVPEAPAVVAPRGPVTRAEVERALAGGLGVFLAGVRVEPVLEGGQFVGFRLVGARHLPEWRAAGLDLRAGDVVVRINGVRVVRPEHAMTAFMRLRGRREIELEVVRAGGLVTLRHPIVDAAPVAAQN